MNDETYFVILSDDRRAKLIEAIASGFTVKIACEYAGVNPLAYHAWKRGAEVYLTKTANKIEPDAFEVMAFELFDAIESQRFKNAKEAMGCIFSAMPKDWRAAERWLEMNYPEDYGSKAKPIKEEEKKTPVFAIYSEPNPDASDD